MKQPIFFPFYLLHSDIVKVSLGLKDNRSVEKFFADAGIRAHDIAGKRCVMCMDLLNVAIPKQQIFHYEAQSAMSRKIDELE